MTPTTRGRKVDLNIRYPSNRQVNPKNTREMLKPRACNLRDMSACNCAAENTLKSRELPKNTRGAKWLRVVAAIMATNISLKNAASKERLLFTGLNSS